MPEAASIAPFLNASMSSNASISSIMAFEYPSVSIFVSQEFDRISICLIGKSHELYGSNVSSRPKSEWSCKVVGLFM